MSDGNDVLNHLMDGWHSHHSQICDNISQLAAGQDPSAVVLTCSDSRLTVDEIFGVHQQGVIFECRNVGGLVTDETLAGLVYALNHLHPKVLVILHHTNCGGYQSLSSEGVEPEIRRHMRAGEADVALHNVEVFLGGGEAEGELKSRLIVEEGARIQTRRFLSHIKRHHPSLYARFRNREIQLMPAVYDVGCDRIYIVPKTLEDSRQGVRRWVDECSLDDMV